MKPRITIDLCNDADRILVMLGYRTPDQVRRVRLPAVVDVTCAWVHLLPAVAATLGLRPAPFPSAPTRVDGGWIEILERGTHCSAVVDPDLHHIVVGHVYLGALDLLVDEATGTVYPPDPDTIICEV
jgi:hypothetical protein